VREIVAELPSYIMAVKTFISVDPSG